MIRAVKGHYHLPKVWQVMVQRQVRGNRYCSKACYTAKGKSVDRRCPQCGIMKLRESFKVGYCRDCYSKVHNARQRKPEQRYSYSMSQAKRRKLEWSIAVAEYLSLISRPCHYCGRKLDETGCGLDRIECSGGYTIGNVVPCCGRCNAVKLDHFTYAQMMRLSVTIREIDSEALITEKKSKR